MTSPEFGAFVNPIATWAVNVVLEVTGVIAIALLVGSFLRSPVTRHGLLLSSLLLVLFSPAIAACLQWSEKSLVKIVLVSAPGTPAALPIPAGALTTWQSDEGSVIPEEFNPIAANEGHAAAVSNANPPQRMSELARQTEESTFRLSPSDSSRKERDAGIGTRSHIASAAASSTSLTDVLRSLVQTLGAPLLLIWFFGTCLLMLKLAVGCYRLAILMRAAIPNSHPLIRDAFERAARSFGDRPLPELVLSSRVSGPLSAGWIHPRVILPLTIIDQLTSDQLHDVLVHEIAHVVRRDPLIVLLQNITAALFWPHPLVTLLNRRLGQAREEICDNYVLNVIDAASYSRTLLTMAQLTHAGATLPGTAGLFTSRWKLEWRVADLLNDRRSRGTSLTWRSAMLVGVVASAMIAVTMLATVSIAVEGKSKQDDVGTAKQEGRAKSEEPDDGLLTLRLDLQLRDGSPVPGAIVETTGQYLITPQIKVADKRGRAQIRDLFEHGARISARSADGRFQATLTKNPNDLRRDFANPIALTLTPAIQHRVVVTSEGRPAADVLVIGSGVSFSAQQRTGPDGIAVLNLPADDKVLVVVASDPRRGAAAVRVSDERPLQEFTTLSLLPPAPLQFRFVDQRGDPAADVEFGLHVQFDDANWILARDLQMVRSKTNQQGEADLSWLPRDQLKRVEVQIVGSNWKVDSTDLDQLSQRVVTVHVRRQKPVVGRLSMPDGRNPEGVLICGSGFSTTMNGTYALARVRRNGSFMFHAASDHGYAMGVADADWGSDIWTGVILSDDAAKSPQIKITAYPATPVTTLVTRGAHKVPVAGVMVYVKQSASFEWIDSTGKKHNCLGGVSGSWNTDARGQVRVGVGRGTVDVSLYAGKWHEDQSREVTSTQPQEFLFHREWDGNRQVIASLTKDGEPYLPSSNLLMRAWTNTSPYSSPVYEPVLKNDNLIEVNFDEKAMELVVVDRERQMSGFGRVGLTEKSVELAMFPTATYSGTLFDEKGAPLVDRTLKLTTAGSFQDVATPQVTDHEGRFHFDIAPSLTPLRIDVTNDLGQPQYFLFTHERLFEPGEVRHSDELRPTRTDKNKEPQAPKRAVPLAERLASTCENVRVSHMHALLVLQGDESPTVTELTTRLFDYDKHKFILHYLPITVPATQLPLEKPLFEDRKWPQPGAGEVVLIALDGDQKTLATMIIGTADLPDALLTAKEFVVAHRPAPIDAGAQYEEACRRAEREHRRVFVLLGGTRCGPCFRMSRWIDRHLAVLEKDFVIFKFIPELDENTQGLIDQIGGQKQGVPYYVLTEPDGTILTTSESLLGNIGMPGTVEDLRHFRRMLEKTTRQITAKEIGQLIESLATK
ncbi:M56 family metallopeptidase [Schlesneria paludicola]|uniref:M56 family metallopeptidase n=1 Tax=Schlesneria paludicola TaxID=360056 RepID=UPI00029A4828|nr:M56 family metallopeptidase [Schlesneria paludicola]